MPFLYFFFLAKIILIVDFLNLIFPANHCFNPRITKLTMFIATTKKTEEQANDFLL